MARDIRVKRVTTVQDLRDLLNRIAVDDPGFQVFADRMADAAAGPRYVVVWEKGDVVEPDS